jgi:hypothetical protein
LDESANCEIASKQGAGFKICEIEKNPHTKAIKLMPFTDSFNFRKKKEMGKRRTRDPAAKIPTGKSGKEFPTMIPVISDRHTGIKGGNLI